MDEKKNSYFNFFSASTMLYILLIIIIGNLFIIDIAIFGNNKISTSQVSKPIDNEKQNLESAPTQIAAESITPTKKLTPKPKKTVIQQTINQPSVREFFVPLGSGSSTSSDWADIPGATAYIDSTLYENISRVTFEASLHTPTGNQTASARLYNVSDAHPVWNSEVTIEGGTPQLKISGFITLDKGNKLYQVQLKTQLKDRTNLENARIHIITK